MHRNTSVSSHNFAMIPRAEIPRSAFNRSSNYKTTFDAGYLVPVFVEEILPGDTFKTKMAAFARLATPIFPLMDNLYLDSFFFFVPYRLVWNNWAKFMGEQDNPGDSTSYVIPQQVAPAGGYAVNSLQDYMELPTGVAGFTHSALYLRAYNLIWNEWFRDQNLQNSVTEDKGDGPDNVANYTLLRRGKRHDYFTSCLPWPQKGAAVVLPLGTSAPVNGALSSVRLAGGGASRGVLEIAKGGLTDRPMSSTVGIAGTGFENVELYGTLTADLSSATAATINQIRTAFQIQKLLERDARGGTRYTEIIRSHFGVVSPDARLQRPEYLGGGSSPILLNPIAQQSATGVSGGTTPLGTLAAIGTMTAYNHGFTQSFTEHGCIIGLISVRADLNYQQGLNKKWSRTTRNDHYFPAFASLGEQAVLNQEIYCQGSANPSADAGVFGYQERWAEYRYKPNAVTGRFRSTAATPLDAWHLAQNFSSLPTLNSTFIQETPPVSRVVAVGASANGSQLLLDAAFDSHVTRAMPMYSVPGLIDHF